MKCKFIDRYRLPTRSATRIAALKFIEGWNNPSRRHSRINYLSPIEYERRFCRTLYSESTNPRCWGNSTVGLRHNRNPRDDWKDR